ncbi:hypothetical protein ACJIZ3_017533 [Penstemon smallii]|uniref:PRA1 family protein n=1 Tax=Penstemon smallii TaxID=265156 RepID=A0ABD3SWK4_9LAMI
MSTQPSTTTTTTTSFALFRPWQQFLNPSALSLSISFSESTYRLTQNLNYFLPNYALITFLVFLLTLITRPLSLILFICICGAWIYLLFTRDEPLTLFNYDIDQKIILGTLCLMTLVALFWTHVWLKLFLALVIGGLIAFLHALLRAPEDSSEDSPPRGEYASV